MHSTFGQEEERSSPCSLQDTPRRVTHHRDKTLFSPRYDCIPFAMHTHIHTHTLHAEFTLELSAMIRFTTCGAPKRRNSVFERQSHEAAAPRKVRGVLASCGDPQLPRSLFLRAREQLPFPLFLTDRAVTQSTRASGSEFLLPSVVEGTNAFFCARSAYDSVARDRSAPRTDSRLSGTTKPDLIRACHERLYRRQSPRSE